MMVVDCHLHEQNLADTPKHQDTVNRSKVVDEWTEINSLLVFQSFLDQLHSFVNIRKPRPVHITLGNCEFTMATITSEARRSNRINARRTPP